MATLCLLFSDVPILHAEEKNPEPAQLNLETVAEPRAANRLQLAGALAYGPPIIDMDDYDRGVLGAVLDGQYLFSRWFGLGIRSQLATLLITSTEADLRTFFIDVQALAASHLWRGLQLTVGLGATFVVNSLSGIAAGDAHFSLAVGGRYTFWLPQYPLFGLEVGLEFDMMFNDDFKYTGTESGVVSNNVYAYGLLVFGVRYSLGL